MKQENKIKMLFAITLYQLKVSLGSHWKKILGSADVYCTLALACRILCCCS